MRARLLACVLVLASCVAVEERIAAERLPDLVLQRGDVPAFSQFAFGPQATADAHPGPRKDAQRFGRLGGWIARYRPVDAAEQDGPLVIESRADLFPSAEAAVQDIEAYRAEYRELVRRAGGRELGTPNISGGESACAFEFGGGSDVFYLVAWQSANATASIVVEGASVTIGNAMALAKTQQAHLDDAAR